MPKGTPIGATIGGTVIEATFNKSYGNVVKVKDALGNIHIYAHLDKLSVQKGQKIGKGVIVGNSGSTGRSTGPHLHYEVRNGKNVGVDPTPYLTAQNSVPKAMQTQSTATSGLAYNQAPMSVKKDIDLYAKNVGVDARLIAAIIQTESNFKPQAVSGAGAKGYMQLMPATAKGLGVNPNDPSQNIRGGAMYIKQQLQKYSSVALALAAYNAGPGNVDKAIKKAGTTDWEIVKKYLPKETQNYVPKVIGYY